MALILGPREHNRLFVFSWGNSKAEASFEAAAPYIGVALACLLLLLVASSLSKLELAG